MWHQNCSLIKRRSWCTQVQSTAVPHFYLTWCPVSTSSERKSRSQLTMLPKCLQIGRIVLLFIYICVARLKFSFTFLVFPSVVYRHKAFAHRWPHISLPPKRAVCSVLFFSVCKVVLSTCGGEPWWSSQIYTTHIKWRTPLEMFSF